MTLAFIARDAVTPAVAPSEYPMRQNSGSRDLDANCDLELDLDRVIYDPEYRNRMRDALNGRDGRLNRP